jgi:hypothetical protein
MKSAQTQRAVFCGMIDGSLFISVVLFFLLLLGEPGDLQKLLTTHWQYLVFGLCPFGLLIMWRGTRDAKKLLAGEPSFLRAPVEGFVWGFTISMLLWLTGYVSEVMAAGGHFDGVIGQPTNLAAWGELLFVVVIFSFITGLIGAIIATILHVLNRVLVGRWKQQTSII